MTPTKEMSEATDDNNGYEKLVSQSYYLVYNDFNMNGYANTGRRCLICGVIQKCLVCSRDSSNPKERLVILAGGRVRGRRLVHETGL
uniref:Uncharacterized protein n=1 Tax=Rhizophagus irregularis (strain DAOM 181602 / DAOM 197198 / MUCL 43194) TaxID=747089 RepID=U9U8U5_RHIID